MNKICPIPFDSECIEWLEQIQAIEDLKEETEEACSIPKAFFEGVPSEIKTATEVEMLLRSRK